MPKTEKSQYYECFIIRDVEKKMIDSGEEERSRIGTRNCCVFIANHVELFAF